MTIRSRMRSILVIITLEHLELFALELEEIAEFDFVYILASTNINQSVPNLVTMNMTLRLGRSSTMDLIRLELFELSALELEKLPYLTLFTL